MRFHSLFEIFLRAEFADDVKEDDDADEAQARDQDGGRSDLQSGTVVGVKLQDVVPGTLRAAATCALRRGRCHATCLTTLCCLMY